MLPTVERVWHPLCGRPSPRASELLERCEPDARATLELAIGFARERVAHEEALVERERLLHEPPSATRSQSVREPARCVTATDLLRALLARDGDRVIETCFHADDRSASLANAVAHWRERATAAASPAPALELEAIWARRWALDTEPQGAIDQHALFDSLPLRAVRALAELGTQHAEGLVTSDEALHALLDRRAAARGYRARIPLAVNVAYWDRRDALAELDRLVARPPGVVIVGRPGSGRHALVEAWGRRLRTAGPAEVRRFGFNIDNYHGGGFTEWRGERTLTFAFIHPRCIFVISSFGAQLDDERALPEDRRFPHHCIDFALDSANDARLIAILTPEELARREAQLPALRELPRLDVPPIDDDEVLPLWICHAPALEEQLDVSLRAPRLIDRIAWRSPERWRDFDVHRDLACDEQLTPAQGWSSTVEHYLHNVMRKRSYTDRVVERFLDKAAPPLRTLVGDVGRLRALFAIDAALHGTTE